MSAFSEELLKLAAAKGKMSVPQTRKGRRSMRVDTMLKKEKDGSLYKYTKLGAAWAKLAVSGEKLPVSSGIVGSAKRKPGDAPTVTDDMVFAGDEDAEWTQPRQVKSASFHSFFDEFLKLGAVTREEAGEALGRLKELEEEKPTIGELGRGSATGAIVGPGAMIAATGAKGGLSRKAVTSALSTALKGAKPGRFGKAKAIGGLIGGALAAPAASGAVFGTGLPLVRRKMDVEAEKERLRQYTGTSRRGRVHRQATEYLGV